MFLLTSSSFYLQLPSDDIFLLLSLSLWILSLSSFAVPPLFPLWCLFLSVLLFLLIRLSIPLPLVSYITEKTAMRKLGCVGRKRSERITKQRRFAERHRLRWQGSSPEEMGTVVFLCNMSRNPWNGNIFMSFLYVSDCLTESVFEKRWSRSQWKRKYEMTELVSLFLDSAKFCA